MTTLLTAAPAAGVLVAHDLERARKFYHDTLGLRVQDAAEGQFVVETGTGSQFMVYENPNIPAPQNTTLGFAVDNVPAAVSELKSMGVKFEEIDEPSMGIRTENGIADTDQGKAAWFKDTEGNWIAINEMPMR